MTKDDVQVAWISDKKERGLITCTDKSAGSILLRDTPLINAQFLFNKHFFRACSQCLKSLERPDVMLKRLAGLGEVPELPLMEEYLSSGPNESGGGVTCLNCFDELYCSHECRQAAWTQFHRKTCLGPNPPSDHPLLHLEEFWKSFHKPPEQTTPTILTTLIGTVLCRLDDGMSPEEAVLPFASFKQNLINDEAQLSALFLDNDEFGNRLRVVQECLSQSLYDDRIPHLFSYESIQHLFCLVYLNGQGIGTSSYDTYQRFLRSLPATPENESALSTLDTYVDAIDHISGDFTVVDGIGLFPMHKHINHSCDPNAEIVFMENSSRLSVVAKTDIPAGNEITISYIHVCDDESDDEENSDIDEDDKDDELCQGSSSSNVPESANEKVRRVCLERREMLKTYYLFDCGCEKCLLDMSV